MADLTHKQRKFVDAWLKCHNATEAARQAGYSERSLREMGSRLMRHSAVKAAIQTRQTSIAERADTTKAGLVALLSHMIYTDLRDVMDWDGQVLKVKSFANIPEWVHPAIQEIRQRESLDAEGNVRSRHLEIKLVPKLDVIRELNEMLGYHAEKPTGGAQQFNLVLDLRGASCGQPHDVPVTGEVSQPEATPA